MTNEDFYRIVVATIVALFTAFIVKRKLDHKCEIRCRRKYFNRIREGKENNNPKKAIHWLAHQLYGLMTTVAGSGSNRRFHITESDLGISPDDYRQVITTLLGIWWNELEVAQPTLSDALNPYHYFERKFNVIKTQMDAFAIGEDILGKNSSLLITNCVQNCCAMLENALQFFPETPGTKPSAGELHEALQEYWTNPTHEMHNKWQKWVEAAYLRQANHILLRLRRGHYPFPESDNQVDKIATLLVCAKAEHDAIDTNPTELQRLRGFMTSV